MCHAAVAPCGLPSFPPLRPPRPPMTTRTHACAQVFDAGSRTVLRQLKAHKRPTHVARFSPDRLHVLSGSDDVTVRWWDITSGAQLRRLDGHSDYVRAAGVSPVNAETWATGGYDHTVKLWDVRTKACSLSLDHGAPVEDLAFFSSGQCGWQGCRWLVGGGCGRSPEAWLLFVGLPTDYARCMFLHFRRGCTVFVRFFLGHQGLSGGPHPITEYCALTAHTHALCCRVAACVGRRQPAVRLGPGGGPPAQAPHQLPEDSDVRQDVPAGGARLGGRPAHAGGFAGRARQSELVCAAVASTNVSSMYSHIYHSGSYHTCLPCMVFCFRRLSAPVVYHVIPGLFPSLS
jgi:WD40 repeat protein